LLFSALARATEPETALEIEFKIQLTQDSIDAFLAKAGAKLAQAKRQDVAFYDTQALDLHGRGLILRARLNADGELDDSTVKLRSSDARRVSAPYSKLPRFKCEIDRNAESEVEACSLSLDYPPSNTLPDSIWDSMSADQRGLAEAAWGGPLPASMLRRFGPAEAYELKKIGPDTGLRPRPVADYWILPNGLRLFELSARVPRSDVDRFARELREWARALGAVENTQPLSKTETMLRAFAL
jgi:hypothetical protein